ncbi:hypothetical protein [Pseudofrankia sp. BMG5.36]|uniref:hypothetical protein n=1 Tax=Pseudofrankia sp. BMG5.36 TaxID=1834512 RepID=UPI0008DA43DA|nr:hypothetical protein [Pseudofrankia sp. BMG5.36]OHV61398.1 hypothetical protein BCD48_39725 [Pseudofrankia sp. BMG5.36]
MPEIARRSFDRWPEPTRYPLVAYAPPRGLQRSIDREFGVGMESAARMEAIGYTTNTALSCLGALSKAEADIAATSPQAAERAQAIVDAFTAVAVAEVAELYRPRYDRPRYEA